MPTHDTIAQMHAALGGLTLTVLIIAVMVWFGVRDEV